MARKNKTYGVLAAAFQQKFMLFAMHTAIRYGSFRGGEVSDYRCALALIDGMKTDALLADKG